MKKVSELELYQVDYLVGKEEFKNDIGTQVYILNSDNKCYIEFIGCDQEYSPTTNPSQAWPIIESDDICIEFICSTGENKTWFSKRQFDEYGQYGKTSLEAAMRCFTCSVYGVEVDINKL